MSKYTVAALYKFVDLPDYKELQPKFLSFLKEQEICGTLLLAKEGINGTVAGFDDNINNLLNFLKDDSRFNNLSWKISYTEDKPFLRTKVKLKNDIVTLGKTVDPTKKVGTYVKPKDWNSLISDPSVILVDTRNDYEVGIGKFKNAIDPNTKTFREFPDYVKNNLSDKKDKKIAMYCTGGIRCEKSTSYLLDEGFDEVYHLEGGILKYLEEVPQEESLWEGECFVFDERVAVNHKLEVGKYDQCYGCRSPITEQDKLSNEYKQGIHCPKCFDLRTEQQKASSAEREKQIRISESRNQSHLG